jgi:hypothetical protein
VDEGERKRIPLERKILTFEADRELEINQNSPAAHTSRPARREVSSNDNHKLKIIEVAKVEEVGTFSVLRNQLLPTQEL